MQISRIAQNSYMNNQMDGNRVVKNVQTNPIAPTAMPSPTDKLNMLKSILGEKELYKLGVIQCQTCESRRYQDGSDDPGVSFKAPGKISPEASASVVKSHEMEHVGREKAKAVREDREVVSQSVQLFTSVCPECGSSYVSGGKTTTTIASKKRPGIDEELLKGIYVDERK